MLFISDNVLEADVIRSMYRVRKEIENIQTEFGELRTMRKDGIIYSRPASGYFELKRSSINYVSTF